MDLKTKAISAGREPLKSHGSVSTPVHRTSTVLFPTLKAYQEAESGKAFYDDGVDVPDYSYGIMGTPTNFALQKAVAEIDQAKHCVIYPSGLSAITNTLLTLLKPGDHVLMVDTVYGPTRRFCNKELKRINIDVTYYDPLIGAEIKDLIQENTKMLFLESPGSLSFEIQDVPTLVDIAKAHKLITVIDNSWASGFCYNPFAHGVDLSIQAGTKYMNGHSDALFGSVTTNNSDFYGKLTRQFRNTGLHVSPDVCYLALRGLRTMPTRLKQHEAAALEVAEFLASRKEVSKILHPAFPDCPGHELWKRDFSGSTGLFAILLDQYYSFEAVSQMVDHMEHFGIGCSWGGFESLILQINPAPIRTATSWPHKETCLRLYIGLESPGDLIADLEKGLERLRG